MFSEHLVKKYIKFFSLDSAPGLDGIKPEHLKSSLHTTLPVIVSNMLTVCLRYGVLPKSFYEGLMVPILKKSNLDPGVPSNYRPITVSSAISKILEYYMLDQWSGHTFSKAHFGFIKFRGTDLAIALAHDLGKFCNASGSPSFYCSLDVQGAFDRLSHVVLLQKAMDIIPESNWALLYYWYQRMAVSIKWNNVLGSRIEVKCGTRQGGLTLPYLFNLFYQDLIVLLNSKQCGVTIQKYNYNVSCYADLFCATS